MLWHSNNFLCHQTGCEAIRFIQYHFKIFEDTMQWHGRHVCEIKQFLRKNLHRTSFLIFEDTMQWMAWQPFYYIKLAVKAIIFINHHFYILSHSTLLCSTLAFLQYIFFMQIQQLRCVLFSEFLQESSDAEFM